jgi:glucuronate isomerase
MTTPCSVAPGVFDDDFLLTTRPSRALYHEVAKDLPIIDYHCHLPPRDLALNRSFAHLTEIWLEGDHYKWRAMRANGVAETHISGQASPREKFMKWAETVPFTVLNPLFHWTHLELKRPFGIRQWLNPKTAPAIWSTTGRLLAKPAFAVHGLLRSWKVEWIGTTDDPTDDLAFHRKIRKDNLCPAAVCPTFRPDRAWMVEQPKAFGAYQRELAAATDLDLDTFDTYVLAHAKRIAAFHAAGCRMSDHAFEAPPELDFTEAQLRSLYRKARAGKALAGDEADRFRAGLLYRLGLLYAEYGWTQQFHIGALRNVNTRTARRLGADAGCDTIGDRPIARGLARLLDRLDGEDRLPRTILYNLNPADNELFATMIGNFQDGSMPGKIQYGSGWWFLDQKDGMERQMSALANMGLISRFIGMITDSRSFLSYSRHEYFRRILCDLFGRAMQQGLIPNDRKHIGGLVAAICYHNIKRHLFAPAQP